MTKPRHNRHKITKHLNDLVSSAQSAERSFHFCSAVGGNSDPYTNQRFMELEGRVATVRAFIVDNKEALLAVGYDQEALDYDGFGRWEVS